MSYLLKLTKMIQVQWMAVKENILRLPVKRCQHFQTERECLNAMDIPFEFENVDIFALGGV